MNQLRQFLAIAGFALAAALFAIPADEARAHNDPSATLHAEAYPLHRAIIHVEVDAINHFLTVHAVSVDVKDNMNRTPLHHVAGASGSESLKIGNNRVLMVATLIAEGAKLNLKDNSGSTPLHYAAFGNYPSVVAALIAADEKVSLNVADGLDLTPLHYAAAGGYVAVVDSLIEADANVTLKDILGSTPLHYAAASGSYDVVVGLLAADADVNAQDDNDQTPLHNAAKNGHPDVVAVLLAEDAVVNLKDKDGKTPLHLAVDGDHSSVVRSLILLKGHYGEACANGFVVNPAGASPPCVCPANMIAANGACEIAVVCNSPSRLNPDTQGCDCPAPNIGPDGAAAPGDCVASCGGLTPFHDAAAGLCVPFAVCTAPLILDTTTNQCGCPAGYDVVNDECVCPPEHGVLADGTCGACPAKQFVQGGVCAAPGAQSCEELTPAKFYDSAADACVAVAECAAPSVLNTVTNQCDCPAPNIGVDGAAAPGDCHGENALHVAAGAGDLVSVNYLITAHMADVNATVSGETPLHAAAGSGHVSVVLTLLAEGAAVNGEDNGGLTPLRWAAFRDHAAVVAALIAAGGHYGEACANPSVVNPAGPDPSCVCESPNVGTPGACAAPGAQSCEELTPAKFYDSAAVECVALAECAAPSVLNTNTNLCDCPAPNIGADGAAAPGDCHGENALHAAAGAGDLVSVNYLIAAHMADVNATVSGETPLHAAAGNGHVSVVLTLLAEGAAVNGEDNGGLTPLRWAAFRDHAAVVAALIAAGGHYGEVCANPAVVNPAGPDPSCVCESPNVGTPGACAAPGAQSCEELTPAKFYDSAAVECVALAECAAPSILNTNTNQCDCPAPNIGADGAAAPGDCHGENALHAAAGAGDLVSVNYLIAAHMADVNATVSGETPLHAAAGNGHVSVVLTLLAEGAAVNGEDNGGLTPLRWAAFRDHAAVVAALIAAGGHYGEVCANPAVVNPAGPDPSCVCESPNVGTPGACAAPGAQSCQRLNPAKFYDSAAVECVALAECAAPSVLNTVTNQCDCPVPNIGADGAVAPGDCHGENALHTAAGAGDLVSVNYLIAAHMADVNATVSGETPLHAAAGNGHVSVVLTLLAEGAAVNGEDNGGLTPLRWAAFQDHAAVVAALIAAGGHYGEVCANPAVVNPAGPDPSCVCESPNVGTPGACAAPGVQGCQRLNPAKFYDSAADACVAFAECAAPSVLNTVTNQCDCPAPNIGADGVAAPGDCHGENALHAAAGAGDLVSVNYLIAAHMADVNATVSGETPLHAAAGNGHVSVVLTLLAEGANVNAKSGNIRTPGWTPLHYAAGYGHISVVLTLLAEGAEVNATDNDGLTPLRWADVRHRIAQAEATGGGLTSLQGAGVREYSAVFAALLAAGGHYGAPCANPAVVNPAGPVPSCVCPFPNVDRNGVCFPESGDLDDLEDLRDGGVSDNMLCGGFGGTVQTATGGEKVCSGMDANGTFCIIDSTDGFPCQGLFKHLWTCNVKHNRPALNPFFCGPECGAQEKAVGKLCVES